VRLFIQPFLRFVGFITHAGIRGVHPEQRSLGIVPATSPVSHFQHRPAIWRVKQSPLWHQIASS